MNIIIQQIALDLVEKIMKMAFETKISHIDTLASDVLVECKAAVRSIIEAISDELNHQIRDDKAGRKALGLVLKEKDRKMSLITELGELHLPWDYYYDNRSG